MIKPLLDDLRMADTERLSMYMAQRGLDTTFWNNVKLGKQNPWEKLRANYVNKQMMQYSMKVQI